MSESLATNAEMCVALQEELRVLRHMNESKGAELTRLRAALDKQRGYGFNAGLEAAAKIALNESVNAEETGSQEDVAYNTALEHAAAAIRILAGITG